VSAESGEGLPAVAGAIAEALSRSKGELSLDAPLVTRERQRLALQRAREELMQFREAWTTHSVPPVIAAVHLRDAARELEELVGAIDVEDVLDRLFSSFCVGK
jgi:tRNA modification GTPase